MEGRAQEQKAQQLDSACRIQSGSLLSHRGVLAPARLDTSQLVLQERSCQLSHFWQGKQENGFVSQGENRQNWSVSCPGKLHTPAWRELKVCTVLVMRKHGPQSSSHSSPEGAVGPPKDSLCSMEK